MKRIWAQARRGLLCLLLVGSGGVAHAACVTSATNVSLGTVSSLALQTTTMGNYGASGISCTGGLSLLSGSYVRLMLNTASLNLTNGGYSIPYTVSTTQGGAPLQNGVTGTATGLTVLSLGGGSNGIALYFTVPMGPNVQAGTYTGTVSFRWYYAICDAGVLGACAWSRSPGLVQGCVTVVVELCSDPTNWGTGVLTSATLTLVVTKSCLINTATLDVDFGSKALVNQFTKFTQTVNVTCTNNEGYSVSFDNGGNYSAPWRQMASGANRMRYNLYQPNTTVIWNATQPMAFLGTGLGQSFTFDAAVDATQNNVPAGAYQDNVIMTLSY
ncbi:Csu type fimbrial protein [Pseudomonas turukhanskensis]|nr:spore coat U domain-containing protein [Pseudomonas turukhanskensis]